MKKKGFTIVELVVVIAVIAILSSVIVPEFVSFFNNSNTQIVQIYNNINNQDSEIIVKDDETKEVIYQGKMSEWQDKNCYSLISYNKENETTILFVRRN